MDWTYDYDYDPAPLGYAKKFKDLPNRIKRDLLLWFNRDNPSNHELNQLYSLYKNNKFKAWNCPNCGARVYFGAPVLENKIFKSVLNLDLSPQGNIYKYQPAYLSACCNSCRKNKLK